MTIAAPVRSPVKGNEQGGGPTAYGDLMREVFRAYSATNDAPLVVLDTESPYVALALDGQPIVITE